ncbi:MAG TPA: hypothetical protein VKT77_10965 [Chthonomonadaceae bacterium]|nr:hypothetical protein [Chthonomonadaceae bacterium]
MHRNLVLSLVIAILLAAFGFGFAKPGSRPLRDPTYDLTWYDSSGAVISTVSGTSDLDGTIGSPPCGADSYLYYDTSDSTSTFQVWINPGSENADDNVIDTTNDNADELDGTAW